MDTYEKKYKEVFEKAKAMHEEGMMTERLEYLFPELKESEDEKIRKGLLALIEWSKSYAASGITTDDANVMIAWLEKQGDIVSYYEDKLDRCACKNFNKGYKKALAWLEKQKPTDKVEPKFKVGDYVVGKYISGYITEVRDDCYLLGYQGFSIDKQDDYHLWTIQDAKDGDVLARNNELLSICVFAHFDGINNKFESFLCHCGLEGEGLGQELSINGYHDDSKDYVPATKEQRDLLFQKMKEAGYQWDTEKKELNKIDARENLTLDDDLREADCMIVEQKPDIEMKTPEESLCISPEEYNEFVNNCFYGESKPVLSEEDEAKLKSACALIRNTSLNGNEGVVDSTIDWLKSLKKHMKGE